MSGRTIVWILEDEIDLLEFMKKAAELKGHEVLTAHCMKQAWDLLDRFERDGKESLPPHIVISDLHLGDGDSKSWLLHIAQRFPAARIFCVSACLTADLEQRLRAFGVAVRHKPLGLAELFELLTPSCLNRDE